MSVLLLTVFVLSTLALLSGALLGFADHYLRTTTDPIVESINSLLPQSQCGQCGYPGCLPYAQAVVNGSLINKCIPGGLSIILKIAEKLNIDPQSIELSGNTVDHFETKVAWIDENNCIGCTRCIQVCPVDAIIGAKLTIHTVISNFCTGCNLCIEPCPTNCIKIRKSPDTTEY